MHGASHTIEIIQDAKFAVTVLQTVCDPQIVRHNVVPTGRHSEQLETYAIAISTDITL